MVSMVTVLVIRIPPMIIIIIYYNNNPTYNNGFYGYSFGYPDPTYNNNNNIL